MANPARELRLRAQERWVGATVVQRGRNFIRHQHPSDPRKKILDAVMGPIHIAGTETEIDTAWTVGDSAPWRRRMILADYHAYAGSNDGITFNSGQILKYIHPASGLGVAFQPQSLDWTNDLGQIQQISQPLQVGATVNDDTLTWTGAYGTGLDFHWQTQTARLQKRLVVNALSNLPTPNATILSGGNPVLRLPFIFQPDSGVDIYVNGVLWNRNANNPQTTTGTIEFRLNATGETLWYFTPPFAFDNSPNAVPVVSQRIRRSGSSLFVEVRVPWSWLQTAVYPVTIDPTIDPTTGTDTDDGKTGPSSDYSNNENVWAGYYYGAWNAWQRFPSVSGLSGVTIDVSYITASSGGKTGSPATRIYAERAAAPTYPTSTSDYNGRTLTTAYTTHGGSDAVSPTPSLNSPLQELVDDYDPTAILIFHKDNGSASNENYYGFGNHAWTGAKTLHIEYTEGGGHTITLNQVSETDTAQAIAHRKQKSVGQVTETNIVQAIARVKRFAVAQSSETDTAQALTSRKIATLGQASETDTAQAITRGGIYVTVNQVTETDSAQTISPAKALAVAQASETDTAQAIARVKQLAVAQVTESDAAQAISVAKAVGVGQVSETDAAQAIARIKQLAVTQVTETDSAQAVSPARAGTLGQASETDAAQALTSRKIATLGQVSETDTAQPITSSDATLVNQVEETNTAQPITARKIRTVNQVEETDGAQAITARRVYTLNLVTETDTAQSLTAQRVLVITQVSETDLAQSLFPQKRVSIGQVVEIDSAQIITADGGAVSLALGIASLSDYLVDTATLSNAAPWNAAVLDWVREAATVEDEPL